MTPDATSARANPRVARDATKLRLGVVALGGLGGSGGVAWDISQGLAARGHRVVRLTSPRPHWYAEPDVVVTSASANVPSAPLPARDEWVEALAEDILGAIEQHELDVLSVHYGIGLVEAAVAARDQSKRASPRVFATLHGTDIGLAHSDPEQRARLAKSLGRCDGVTAVSNWLADEALAVLGLRMRPIVIRNAVDPLFFPASHATARPFTLFHASNFRAVKRPLDCIEVLAALRKRAVDARLVMTGDGPLKVAARQRSKARGLQAHVEFHAPVDRAALAGQLRQAHLGLVTSEVESFGLVALEAMASGVPFVGTRCGGLLELLADEPGADLASVLLAETGDIDGLAACAQKLLEDRQLYADVRDRCIRLARAFDRAEQLHNYERLFRGVWETRP